MYAQLFVSCLVSSVGKAVSLLDASLFQLTRHDANSCTYTMCI